MATVEHVEQQGDHVEAFPIAARTNGSHPDYPKPHVGPTLEDYKQFHTSTIGGKQGSDDWWRKVRALLLLLSFASLALLHRPRPFDQSRVFRVERELVRRPYSMAGCAPQPTIT